MIQRREPGGGRVEDTWLTKDKERTKRHGRGKRWRARWVDLDGNERTQAFALKEDAKTHLTDVLVKISRGEYVDRDKAKTTVGQLFEEWEPTTAATVAPKTRYDRQSRWRVHVQPVWGNRQASRIRKNDVTAWVATMHKNGTGTVLISHAVELLRLVLTYGQDAGVITSNPATGVKLPRRTQARRAYLTVEQVEALASQVEHVAGKPVATSSGEPVLGDDGKQIRAGGEQYSTLVRVLAYTGMRWGEATALRPVDVDMQRHRIDVRRAFSSVGGKIIEGSPKTHELRYVPFPAVLDDELATLIEGKDPHGLIFTNTRGGVLSGTNFRNRIWTPALTDLPRIEDTDDGGQDNGTPGAPGLHLVGGLDVEQAGETPGATTVEPFPVKVTVHDLRHTAASLAISSGAHVKAVQAMLGHKSAVMTLDTYADLFDDDLDAVGVAMGSLIEAKRAVGRERGQAG